MRHAALTFAAQLRERTETWDVIWCSDMLDVASFRGLLPCELRKLPVVLYFHENQLTYPDRTARPRDHHFAYTNIISAISADAVWFNSEYHRSSFYEAAEAFLRRMPDHAHLEELRSSQQRSAVHPPGIDSVPARVSVRNGPLRILWNARWEHDKNPETFFAALRLLHETGTAFEVDVLGEQYAKQPAVFAEFATDHVEHVNRWGHQDSRADYAEALREADVVASTAYHEFFGIAVLEAVAAGAWPLVPERLAYPETLARWPAESRDRVFHDGSAADLCAKLEAWKRPEWVPDPGEILSPYYWQATAGKMDQALAQNENL